MTPNSATNADGRFNGEGDALVREFFTAGDLRLSPEEYAAHHAHEWALFSFHLYRFRDPALGAWVRRLGEILFNSEEIERCRRHFLTPEERAFVHEQEAADF